MRRLAVAAGCASTATALLGLVGWLAVLTWRTRPTGDAATAPDVLLTLASAAVVLLAARLAAGAAVGAVAVLVRRAGHPTRGRWDAERVALALTPRLGRPLLALALSASLGVGAAGTATASTGDGGAPAAGTLSTAATAPALPEAGWPAATPPDESPTVAPPVAPTVAEAVTETVPATEVAAPSPTQPCTTPPPAAPAVSQHSPARPVPPSSSAPSRPERPAADVSLVSSGGQVRGAPGRSFDTLEQQQDTVVVRRGDSLWTLAAQHLGPSATDAQINAAWPRWWAANRAVIGSDPDVLLPGTQLVVPTGGEA